MLEFEKKVVYQIMDQLRQLDTRYGVLQYDNKAQIVVNLGSVTDPQNVKNAIGRVNVRNQGTGLAEVDHICICSRVRVRVRICVRVKKLYDIILKVLQEAAVMFERRSRENSRKRLIVFVTTKSDSSPEVLQRAFKTLVDAGVDVTLVALGNNVDNTELETIAPKHKIYLVDSSGSPDTPATGITDQVIKGK